MERTAWAGIDVGKTNYWDCVLDAEGKKLSSMKVANDQTEITATIATVGALADHIVWA
ncbi:IS110 family transposase, partial [Mycobacterium sp. ITM-2017-0098]